MIENKFKYFKLTRAPVRRIFLKHMRNTFHLSLSLTTFWLFSFNDPEKIRTCCHHLALARVKRLKQNNRKNTKKKQVVNKRRLRHKSGFISGATKYKRDISVSTIWLTKSRNNNKETTSVLSFLHPVSGGRILLALR